MTLFPYCVVFRDMFTALIHLDRGYIFTVMIFFLLSSIITILGNLLVIRALWKASSVPATLKTLFISLAFSDLTVGIFLKPVLCGIIYVMLICHQCIADLCPNILTTYQYILHALVIPSFLSLTAIAVDRLLAVCLHLRYQELVTQRRTVNAVVTLWMISFVSGLLFIFLPGHNDLVTVFFEFTGLFIASASYFKIYRVVRYHRIQVQNLSQIQNDQSLNMARVTKSSLSAFYMYLVFVACFLPNACIKILMAVLDSANISLLISYSISNGFILFNSLLNPLLYCWRYREIRRIVKTTLVRFKPC